MISLRAVLPLLLGLGGACGGVPASSQVRHYVSVEAPVVVYGASWCPVTAAAMAWFDQQHIPYVMRDVDRLPREREAMDARVAEAGLVRTGIPVLEIDRHVLVGFDEASVRRVLESAHQP